jgi:hypothetical protein
MRYLSIFTVLVANTSTNCPNYENTMPFAAYGSAFCRATGYIYR